MRVLAFALKSLNLTSNETLLGSTTYINDEFTQKGIELSEFDQSSAKVFSRWRFEWKWDQGPRKAKGNCKIHSGANSIASDFDSNRRPNSFATTERRELLAPSHL
jgi:hypothetical protein